MSALLVRAETVGYSAEIPVLHNVNLEAEPGEVIALFGGNGAGKTTLLHFIAGALTSKNGYASIFGRRITSSRDAARAGVGLVVQDPNDQLLGSTVREDVALGPRNLGLDPSAVSIRVAEALASVGIEALADRQIESLSFGERKRASLAGVLAMRARVLLLDEPTAGLDPAGELSLCTTLKQIADSGTTLVVATHAVDLVPRFATRIVLLGDRRVLFDGDMSELIEEPRLLMRANVRRPWPAELWTRVVAHAPPCTQVPLTLEEAIACFTRQFS
jgi:cobalt/nickel transport system ATP-binding protein